MPLSFVITAIAGTLVRMHILLPLFFVWLLLGRHPEVPVTLHEAAVGLGLLTLMIHEASHFAVARIFKLSLLEVRLYPFGGRYQFRQPLQLGHKFLFYFFPVAVNACIGAAFSDYLGSPSTDSTAYLLGVFASYNLFLAALNLCPCSPLDGGSILRSILEKNKIAHPGRLTANIGQGFCFVLAILAFFLSTPVAVALAVMLLLISFKDKMENRIIANAQGLTARNAFVPMHSIKSFQHNYTVSRALAEASVSAQEIFPVFFGESLTGFVTRGLLLEEAAADPEERYLTEIAVSENQVIHPDLELKKVVELFTQEDVSLIVVVENEKPIGFILKESLLNFLVVKGIQKDQKDLAERDSDLML